MVALGTLAASDLPAPSEGRQAGAQADSRRPEIPETAIVRQAHYKMDGSFRDFERCIRRCTSHKSQ